MTDSLPSIANHSTNGRHQAWLRAAVVLATIAVTGALLAAVVSRLDLVRVTHAIDLAQTAPGGGLHYRNPIATMYRPFITVAPPESRTMRVIIDGVVHPCTATQSHVGAEGGGKCAYENTYLSWSRTDDLDPRTIDGSYLVSYPVRADWELIGFLVVAWLYLIVAYFFIDRRSRFVASVAVVALVLGGGLLALNVAGLMMPLRSPELTKVSGSYGPDDLRYSYEQALPRLMYRDGDTPLRYAQRLNDTIEGAVLHGWSNDEFSRLHIHIPYRENWVLRLLGSARPAYREYLFWNPYQMIERGYGTCGHVASAFVGLMREHGIDARIVTLFGHVVATVEVEPGVWHIFDPDIGVSFPHSLETLEQDEKTLRQAYAQAIEGQLSERSPEQIQAFVDGIVSFYQLAETNHIDTLGRESYHSGFRIGALHHAQVERWSYRLKWLVPLGLLAIGTLLMRHARRMHRRLLTT